MKYLPLPLPRQAIFIITALLALLPVATIAQKPAAEQDSPYQTLVSNEGVSIEAEILRVEGNNAFIRVKDGKDFNFPISMLDEKSRKLVQAWAIDHALANSIEIKVRERVVRREKNDTNSSTGNIRTVQLNFSVLNKSSTQIDNLRIEYRIYVIREQIGVANKDFAQEQVLPGKVSFKPIAGNQEQVESSDSIELRDEKLNGEFIPAQGNKRASQDKVDGYWYRVYRGKNLILEDSSPRRLMRVKTW